MKRAKTLVVGASHWHLPLYADKIAAQHDVVGVSDPDASRVSRLARLWNAPLYSSWEEILAVHGDAELAYVLVPHNAMREVCLALIAKRIPLVVEKPAGVSLQQVTDIRVAAEAAGVPIAVPLVQREGPPKGGSPGPDALCTKASNSLLARRIATSSTAAPGWSSRNALAADA